MGAEPLDIDTFLPQVQEAADYLRPFICDTIPLLHEAVKNDDEILFEGAQGVMLDVDFGTYPFVTSSSTGAGVVDRISKLVARISGTSAPSAGRSSRSR